MALFDYQATTTTGKMVEGVREAGEERAVVTWLHDQGYLPINVAVRDGGNTSSLGKWSDRSYILWRKRGTQRDLLLLTRELSTLVSAGLPLDRALTVLHGLVTKSELTMVVGEILKSVEQGSSLADSLAAYPNIFPTLYVNMVRAGELGGFLDTVLVRLGDHLERTHQVQEEIKSAMAYPTVLVAFGVGAVLFMFMFILPRFAGLFSENADTLPASTQYLLFMSDALRSYWWVLLLACGTCFASWSRYVRTEQGRLQWDRLRLRLVVVGPLVRKREVGRFARTLSTLLSSGVPLLEALEVVQTVVQNSIIARGVSAVRAGVREGEGMAAPLGRTGVFPTLALQMIAVGEETGRLEEMLGKVAEYFDRETEQQLKRMTSLIEPILLLTMGLVLGFVVISMLVGIFSMNEIAF